MFYILHGDEEFTRSEEVRKLVVQVLADGMGDLNITRLDGRKLGLDDLINACNTIPFLTNRRLVIVENLLQRLDPQRRSAGAEAQTSDDEPTEPSPVADSSLAAKLVAYLPQMPPTTRLVFIENKTLGRNNPVLKLAAQTEGSYEREFKPPDEAGLNTWIRQRAKLKGPGIAGDAAGLLASFVGADLRLLDQELEKLAALTGYARPISADDVRVLVSAAHDANIFAMVDTLGLRDAKRAMQQLQELIGSGANELYLLAMIARQFRLILSVKDLAQNRGLQQEDIRKELKISHSFIVEKLARQAQLFSMDELETILNRLLEIDQAIKTGRTTGPLGVELLVIEICSQRRPQLADYQGKSRARTR